MAFGPPDGGGPRRASLEPPGGSSERTPAIMSETDAIVDAEIVNDEMENAKSLIGGTEIPTTDVVVRRVSETGLSRSDFSQIESFEDALAMFGEDDLTYADAGEIGDGSVVLDKADLVGTLFIVTDYRVAVSPEKGNEFVIVQGITRRGTKFVFTDGSKDFGIRQQLTEWTSRKGKKGGLVCQKGLTVSVYPARDETGNLTGEEGRTYRIDQSPVK